MAVTRDCSRRQRHTPFAKGSLSGWLYPRRQHTPFGDVGNKENLNLQYQVGLDSGLRHIRLVPGAGKIKIFH